jgi:hypothetical protein
VNVIPEINKHYFVIYAILIIAVAVFVALKTKMFKRSENGTITDG